VLRHGLLDRLRDDGFAEPLTFDMLLRIADEALRPGELPRVASDALLPLLVLLRGLLHSVGASLTSSRSPSMLVSIRSVLAACVLSG
jgi:hypothetical protein